MTEARYGHTATLLPDGTVLVVGDYAGYMQASSAELYDPATGTWSLTANAPKGGVRTVHTATLLQDGKVLIAGGWTGDGPLNTAEIYDPVDGTWSVTATMPQWRDGHTATLLNDGTVLLVGGWGGDDFGYTENAALFHPADGTWSVVWDRDFVRMSHTATLLPDGRVLVAGGYTSSSWIGTTSVLIYDPEHGTWSDAAPMKTARYGHSATLLPDGKVLVVGGVAPVAGGGSERLSSAEIYNPATNTWTLVASMDGPRCDHVATLLADGTVLVAGGTATGGAALATAELYDPASGEWITAGSMSVPRTGQSATLLGNHKVLMAGGWTNTWYTATAELYQPFIPLLVGPITAQYSDVASLEATVALPTPGGIAFRVNGSADGLQGVPAYDAGSGAAGQAYAVGLAAGAYSITATFSPEDTTTVYSGEATLTVVPEDVAVTPELSNPAAVPAGLDGASGPFTLRALVWQLDDGSPGEIDKAVPVTCALTPAGGSPFSGVASVEVSSTAGPLAAVCEFDDIPAGEYSVVFSVGGDYFAGESSPTTLTVTARPAPSVSVLPVSIQYSDCTSLMAGVDPAESGRLAFRVNGGKAGLLGPVSYSPVSGAGSQGYRAGLGAGEYPILASFSPESTTTVYSGEATLTVTPEAMTVAPNDGKNPSRVTAGRSGLSGSFTLTATFTQERDGCPGVLLGTPVSCTLTREILAAPPGGPLANPIGYTRTAKLGIGLACSRANFAFKGIPAGRYTVSYSVDDGRYLGCAERTLTIKSR